MSITVRGIIAILVFVIGFCHCSEAGARTNRWDESAVVDSFPAKPLRLRFRHIRTHIGNSYLYNNIPSAMDATWLLVSAPKPDSLRDFSAVAFLWLAEELVREGNPLTAEACIAEAEREARIYKSSGPPRRNLDNLNSLLAFQKARVAVRRGKYDVALEEYKKSQRLNHSAVSPYAILGGMSDVYLLKGDDSTAERYLLKAIRGNDEPNSSIAACQYIHLLIDLDRVKEAETYIKRDYSPLKGLESEKYIYEARYHYYMTTGDSLNAMASLATAYDFQDSISYENTATVLQDFATRIIETNRKVLRGKNTGPAYLLAFAAVLFASVTAVLIWRWKRIQKKASSREECPDKEPETQPAIDEEASIGKAVSAEAESSALREIRKITSNSNREVESQMEEIKQLLHECELNDKTRDEFMTHFAQLYPDFLNRLYAVGPGLTKAEIRIACMCFLNMSTKDIATLTHRSANTINSIKRTLRKKLNIASGTEAYFHHLSIATPEELDRLRIPGRGFRGDMA